MKKYKIVFIPCHVSQATAEIVTLTYSNKKVHIPIQVFPVVPPVSGVVYPVNLATVQSMGMAKYVSNRHPSPVLNTDILDLGNLETPPGDYAFQAIDMRQEVNTLYYLMAYEVLF